MDDREINTAVLMCRILHVLTPAQVELFIVHLENLAEYTHGFVTITWRDGKPDLVLHQGSDKA